MLLLPAYLPPSGVVHSSHHTPPSWSANLHPLQVTIRDQQKALLQLSHTINREQFCFTIDLLEEKMVYRHGINRWLGYSDTDFSIKDFQETIHPHHAAVEGIYCRALLDLLTHHSIPLQFMQSLCATTLALRTKQGHYQYVKRECFPFQLNQQQELTEYICVFTLIKEFNRENYHTRFCHPNNIADSSEKLSLLVKKIFSDLGLFSIQELRILKRYAQKKDITSEQMGTAFRIKKTTVDTFNKRILQKSAAFSGYHFGTAKLAALHFKSMGLI